MDKLKALLLWILDTVAGLLAGETARAIGYGGALVVYLVARAIKAIPDVTWDQAVQQVLAVEVLILPIVETIRHYVSSPSTVAALQSQLAAAQRLLVTSTSTTTGAVVSPSFSVNSTTAAPPAP